MSPNTTTTRCLALRYYSVRTGVGSDWLELRALSTMPLTPPLHSKRRCHSPACYAPSPNPKLRTPIVHIVLATVITKATRRLPRRSASPNHGILPVATIGNCWTLTAVTGFRTWACHGAAHSMLFARSLFMPLHSMLMAGGVKMPIYWSWGYTWYVEGRPKSSFDGCPSHRMVTMLMPMA